MVYDAGGWGHPPHQFSIAAISDLLDGEYRSQKTRTKPGQVHIGPLKTEVIHQIGPWKSVREVEWETLKWVDWYNNRHLLGPIGYIPPTEAEEALYANMNTLDMVV